MRRQFVDVAFRHWDLERCGAQFLQVKIHGRLSKFFGFVQLVGVFAAFETRRILDRVAPGQVGHVLAGGSRAGAASRRLYGRDGRQAGLGSGFEGAGHKNAGWQPALRNICFDLGDHLIDG